MAGGADLQRRFAAAIMRIPGARSRRIRDAYVRGVAGLLGADPAFPRSDTAEEDVERLVRWCARQPGGMRRLSEAVEATEEHSDLVARLRALAEIGRPAQVLQPEERHRVERLTAELDDETRTLLLRDLLARWSPRNRPDTSDPQAVLSSLEDAIAGVGEPHPLYVYLSRLAAVFRDPAAGDVEELARQVGDRTGAPPELLVDLPGGTPEPDAQFFVVRLAESGLDPSRYLLDVWLVSGGGTWTQRYTSEQAHHLDDVGPRIDDVLEDLAEDEIEIGSLRIEFILPRPLLDHPVDQWLAAAPGVSSAIGVHYPVVVRDLSRMRNRIIRSRWRRRCRSLARNGESGAHGAVRFEPVTAGDYDLFPELMRDPDRPVCLIVLGPAAEHVQSRIGSWLSAGLPVIAWCRFNDVARQFDQRLLTVINGGGINVLPEAVWRLRQDAGRPPPAGLGYLDHVGRHVTLIWDLESLLPPDEHHRLRQPRPSL